MNDLIILLFWIILGIGFLIRVLFALFFPDEFAEGARENLFIREREKALFPSHTNEEEESDQPFDLDDI